MEKVEKIEEDYQYVVLNKLQYDEVSPSLSHNIKENATRTINEKGETEDIKNLPLGKYIVKEENNLTGYMLDKNTYNVELKYKDQYTKVIADTKN